MKSAGAFDIVIVGGGVAGAILATRLSEDPGREILLIEAGGRGRDPRIAMPLAFPMLAGRSGLNWAYRGEPETAACGRRMAVRMGRGLGGSSLINGLVYLRAHPADFDAWANLGLAGWRYEDVLPWLIRAERHWSGESDSHGAHGPIEVTRGGPPLALTGPLMEAARRIGVLGDEGPSALPLEGMFRPDFAIDRRGRRVSTATAYLRTAGQCGNLRIVTGARVDRLVHSGGRITGVEVAIGRTRVRYEARGEVIVAAGAYQSPHLLMLSGIGDGRALHKVGINSVVELPGVGANLQNHVGVAVAYRLTGRRTFYHKLRADRLALAGLRWLISGGGPLGRIPLAAVAALRTHDGLDAPDVQISYIEGTPRDRPWMPPFRRSKGNRLTILHALRQPRSRGWVRLADAEPATPPRICFNMLDHPNDVATLCAAIDQQRPLLTELDSLGIATDPLGLEQYGHGDELSAFVRENAIVAQHPVGTCAIGNGPDGVVDERFRVRGVDGLRVIDASVMPRIVGANTYATTVMIAERGAAFAAGSETVDITD